jgi:hypothetical protein
LEEEDKEDTKALIADQINYTSNIEELYYTRLLSTFPNIVLGIKGVHYIGSVQPLLDI